MCAHTDSVTVALFVVDGGRDALTPLIYLSIYIYPPDLPFVWGFMPNEMVLSLSLNVVKVTMKPSEKNQFCLQVKSWWGK